MRQKNVPGRYSFTAREAFMKNCDSIEFTPKSFTVKINLGFLFTVINTFVMVWLGEFSRTSARSTR